MDGLERDEMKDVGEMAPKEGGKYEEDGFGMETDSIEVVDGCAELIEAVGLKGVEVKVENPLVEE